jgi:hypothetical protein
MSALELQMRQSRPRLRDVHDVSGNAKLGIATARLDVVVRRVE